MNTELNGIELQGLRRMIDRIDDDASQGIALYKVKTCWEGRSHAMSTATEVLIGGEVHRRQYDLLDDVAPQPPGMNGAPTPQALLLAGPNGCLAIGMVTRAACRGIGLEHLEIRAKGEIDLRAMFDLDTTSQMGFSEVCFTIRLRSQAPREDLDALYVDVLRTSPCLATLGGAIRVVPRLVVEQI